MRRFARLIALLAAAACAAPPPAPDPREQRWVLDVLLGREVGEARDRVVRWREPVHYLVVDADRDARAAVEAAFAQLEQALVGLHDLTLSFVDRDDARCGEPGFATLFFVAPRRAGRLVRRYRARPAPRGADGWFTIVWRADHSLQRAVAFVDPYLSGRWLRHTVLEEMLQVLGPCNDSAILPASVVYEAHAAAGATDRLADVDRRLLRLLYGALQPGDDAAHVVRAMRASWRSPR